MRFRFDLFCGALEQGHLQDKIVKARSSKNIKTRSSHEHTYWNFVAVVAIIVFMGYKIVLT